MFRLSYKPKGIGLKFRLSFRPPSDRIVASHWWIASYIFIENKEV